MENEPVLWKVSGSEPDTKKSSKRSRSKSNGSTASTTEKSKSKSKKGSSKKQVKSKKIEDDENYDKAVRVLRTIKGDHVQIVPPITINWIPRGDWEKTSTIKTKTEFGAIFGLAKMYFAKLFEKAGDTISEKEKKKLTNRVKRAREILGKEKDLDYHDVLGEYSKDGYSMLVFSVYDPLKREKITKKVQPKFLEGKGFFQKTYLNRDMEKIGERLKAFVAFCSPYADKQLSHTTNDPHTVAECWPKREDILKAGIEFIPVLRKDPNSSQVKEYRIVPFCPSAKLSTAVDIVEQRLTTRENNKKKRKRRTSSKKSKKKDAKSSVIRPTEEIAQNLEAPDAKTRIEQRDQQILCGQLKSSFIIGTNDIITNDNNPSKQMKAAAKYVEECAHFNNGFLYESLVNHIHSGKPVYCVPRCPETTVGLYATNPIMCSGFISEPLEDFQEVKNATDFFEKRDLPEKTEVKKQTRKRKQKTPAETPKETVQETPKKRKLPSKKGKEKVDDIKTTSEAENGMSQDVPSGDTTTVSPKIKETPKKKKLTSPKMIKLPPSKDFLIDKNMRVCSYMHVIKNMAVDEAHQENIDAVEKLSAFQKKIQKWLFSVGLSCKKKGEKHGSMFYEINAKTRKHLQHSEINDFLAVSNVAGEFKEKFPGAEPYAFAYLYVERLEKLDDMIRAAFPEKGKALFNAMNFFTVTPMSCGIGIFFRYVTELPTNTKEETKKFRFVFVAEQNSGLFSSDCALDKFGLIGRDRKEKFSVKNFTYDNSEDKYILITLWKTPHLYQFQEQGV